MFSSSNHDNGSCKNVSAPSGYIWNTIWLLGQWDYIEKDDNLSFNLECKFYMDTITQEK